MSSAGSNRTDRCCVRCDNGGWCLLEDGHFGPHEGIARTEPVVSALDRFGPSEATKPKRKDVAR